MNLRPVTKADEQQWQGLWQKYNCFYDRPFFSPEITQVTWARFFDDAEPMYALVAEQHGQLVGLAHYLFHRSTTRIELSCYLQDLYVSEASRGHGIGRQLIEAVDQMAKAAGTKRVYWQTKEDNHAARKLYDKIAKHLGFIVYSQDLE